MHNSPTPLDTSLATRQWPSRTATGAPEQLKPGSVVSIARWLLPAVLLRTLLLGVPLLGIPSSNSFAAQPPQQEAQSSDKQPAAEDPSDEPSAQSVEGDRVQDAAQENDDSKPGTVEVFDGKSLDGWKVADTFDFEDHGPVTVQDTMILLGKGSPATGIVRTVEPPKTNYEVHLKARRTDGRDFFCGLTFPVGDSPCTLILGGWGGGIVGLSNVDGLSAVENATSSYREFEQNRWYAIRLRVTDKLIQVWIDDQLVIDQAVAGHRFEIWWEMEPMQPLGIATWHTASSLKDLRLIQPANDP